jgi:glutaredoxin
MKFSGKYGLTINPESICVPIIFVSQKNHGGKDRISNFGSKSQGYREESCMQ